jgi:endonuclease/exonuclease/phosphatase family metal-dependent hydrolase
VKRLADELDLHAYEPDKEGMGTYGGRDGKRLDWILISRELEFINYRLLPDIVSDHLAVYAEIRPRGEGK